MSIKKCAQFLLGSLYVLLGLSFAAAVIVLGVDIDLWLTALIIIVSGAVLSIPILISAHLIWGFGELVGNSKKMIGRKATQNNISGDKLPEL